LEPLKALIRKYFIQQTTQKQAAPSSRHYKKTKYPKPKQTNPPSERFIWGMLTLITALIWVIVLEATHIITKQVNSERTP
jgi:hypothetical protein